MIATTRILCPECQHENEAERIYCHNCGARLDRGAVISKKEPVVDTRKRVKKMFDPGRAKARVLFFKISKMILGASCLAVVILVALPAEVPPATKTEMLASQVRFDVEKAAAHHQPPQLEFTEDQINAYLGSALRSKKGALNKPLLDFKRAVVVFGEDICRVSIERSLSGYYSLYTTSAYSVGVVNGELALSHKAGYLGRMPIHPKLMPYVDAVFSDLYAALDRDIKLLAKFGAIQFHDKRVVLSAAAPAQ